MSKSSVSVIIPTYRRNPELLRLIRSIKASMYNSSFVEIIVVDNAQDNELGRVLHALDPSIMLVTPESNMYCNGGRRYGTSRASGDYIYYVDDDNVLDQNSIELLSRALDEDASLGIAAPVMCYLAQPDVIWCAGGRITGLGLAVYQGTGISLRNLKNSDLEIEPDFFPNAFMVRRRIMEDVEFDNKNFPHNWSEPDFCLRVKGWGYHLGTVPPAIIWHDIDYGGGTTRLGIDKTFDQAKSRITFRQKHMNRPTTWFTFWGIVFPVSTVLYIRKILVQTELPRLALLKAYFSGTWEGFRGKPGVER